MILQLRPLYRFFLIFIGIHLLCNDLFGNFNSQVGVKAWTIFNPASANYDEHNFAPRPTDFDREDIPKNILIGSYIGGMSHLRPALEISKILSERGYNVALVSPGNFTQPNYPFVKHFSTGPKHNPRDMPDIYHELFVEEYTFFKALSQQSVSNSNYLNRFETYLKAASEFKPDLFLCDHFLNEACYDTAWKLKKPSIGISSWLTPRLYSPYKSDPMFGCHANMELESFFERFRCAIITPIRIIYKSRNYMNELNEIRATIGIAPTSNSIERIKDTFFFADTFFGFETPSHLPPLVQEIGPVMQDEYEPITPAFSSFLAKHKRTMLVSFSTHVYTTPKNIGILLQSFIEAIDRKVIDGIIWSFVQISDDDIPSTISLSDGSTILTDEILNNQNPHIHVSEYVPQFALLNHTNVKIFLSHAGKGCSHEALYTATPMLNLPIAFDQMGNAEALEAAGVALTLSKLNLQVEDIISKIEKLQIDELTQINARRMQVLARINSKRKQRAADMVEFLLLASQLTSENDDDEPLTNLSQIISDDTSKNDFSNSYLNELITPDTRMGFIRGKYLDVFGVLLGGVLIILGSIIWIVWLVASLFVNSVMNLTESLVGSKIKED
ncbi:UDP-Glycosyltransferase/glycogen phosphorylase [Gigaspora margarita]|uniref:UDP-Glycosyltransferase/glycogen phosphorylase n=1 Tax=Gigaspora margarita TaxID=4874 RepID=A0A8H3XEZ4_GIGMA|nr:UDP-Glycosyltransferase/glycogen phosphorylase [Gigaspora margarita]